ncbi:MAG: pirin family protein, partial [Bacillota bacterium]|nr:pirin family protein [Bacillota bacterium]
MSSKILRINEFKFREDVGDPYLARMHHVDYYPKGNGQQGVPAELLKDKSVGEDFDLTSDWKMYYGKEVPGFPVHPHRSFETVTIVLQGFVDHSDSSGLTGRYGAGDVQWMTAGSGMQHAEMFPLVHDDRENTLELFQVWLNLPARDKFVTPYYKMLW